MKHIIMSLIFLILRCPCLLFTQYASIVRQSVDNNQVIIYHLPFAGQENT
jgi:hypothetical protein